MQFLILIRSFTYNWQPHNTTAICDVGCISQVLNFLLPFDSSSKINRLEKKNWEGKFTLLSPNEVTTLATLIRCIKNGTDPLFGTAVTLAVRLQFTSSCWMYWTGPVDSAKETFTFTNRKTLSSLGNSCHRTDRTVCSLFIFTTNEHHSPSCNRHVWPLYSFYQLTVIFRKKSVL